VAGLLLVVAAVVAGIVDDRDAASHGNASSPYTPSKPAEPNGQGPNWGTWTGPAIEYGVGWSSGFRYEGPGFAPGRYLGMDHSGHVLYVTFGFDIYGPPSQNFSCACSAAVRGLVEPLLRDGWAYGSPAYRVAINVTGVWMVSLRESDASDVWKVLDPALAATSSKAPDFGCDANYMSIRTPTDPGIRIACYLHQEVPDEAAWATIHGQMQAVEHWARLLYEVCGCEDGSLGATIQPASGVYVP